MTRARSEVVIKSTRTTLYTNLSDIRTALLALVDVAERMMDKEPRTAEIREMHREHRRNEKHTEVLQKEEAATLIAAEDLQEHIEKLRVEEILTTAPECGKL